MNDLKPQISEDITPMAPKNKRSIGIVALCFFLVLSLAGNAFLGLSWYKYIGAYEDLQEKYKQKESSLVVTDHQLKQAKKDNQILEDTLNEAFAMLAEYDSAYKKLKEQDATSRIPKGYYVSSGSGGNKDYNALKDFLNYDFYLPKDYKLGIFDCSESAAYLEYVLQNNGFDAKIAVGKDPTGSGVGHAWVLVNTKDGMVAVEATVLTGGVQRFIDSINNIMNNSARGVIYYNQKDQISKNYYESYDAIFEDIQETVKYTGNEEEWNWWDGSWGFQ